MIRDRWLDFWHALPPFRGRLAVARIVAQHLLTNENNQVAWAKLPNGFRMKVDLRWQGGYDVLYYFRTYEAALASLLIRAVDDDGAVLIDVGANIGAFCFLAADVLRRRGGTALAIEPLPQNLAFLTESINANDLSDVIVPLPVAVGDHEGVLGLAPLASGMIANARPVSWSESEVTGTSDNILLPMTTLDSIVRERDTRNVRFVKIDIEGAELYALRGARSLLMTQRPLVYAEFHREYARANGTTEADIAAFADSAGYRVAYLSADGAVTETPPPPDSRMLDIVLIPREPSAQQLRVLQR
jgi:FkbM family methyltransferase